MVIIMGRISTISFPGLGIGEFDLNAEAISFRIGNFPVTVMWYGIIICIGIIAGFSYFAYRAKQAGRTFDDILDITLVTVITAIVGARLYFVVFYGGYLATSGTFWQNLGRTLYNIVAIWNGGLAIYGGIIFGFFAVWFMSRRKKIHLFKLTDMVVAGVMLGQLIGRWGNFCNGEAFGATTTLPWRMGLSNELTGYTMQYVHPTFLYESLWNLVGFILINAFYKKRKYYGEATLWYFGWYGLGRAFIELLRTDSLMIGPLRVSSLLSFLVVLAVVPLLIFLRIRAKRAELAADGELPTMLTLFRMPKAEAASEDAEVVTESVSDETETGGEESTESDEFADEEATAEDGEKSVPVEPVAETESAPAENAEETAPDEIKPDLAETAELVFTETKLEETSAKENDEPENKENENGKDS